MVSTAASSSAAAREALVQGTLSWLSANIDAFDPPQEEEVTGVQPEGVMQGGPRKAFGELGLALRLAQRAPALRDRPEVRALSARWLAMAERRNIFFDARRRIHLVPLMAVALAVTTALGGANDSARRALQTVLDRRFLDRTERSAWTQIDIAYYLDAVGMRHAFPDPATLFRRSSLLDLPAVPHALRIDFYATTHLIFHLSDFGARDLPGATHAEQAAIRRYLSLALATCIAERDWDLAGEFMAARICMGDRGDALGDAALLALAQAQQPSGFMPDLAWLRSRETPDTAPPDEFAAVYHPTLVTLIMIACDMAGEQVAARAFA